MTRLEWIVASTIIIVLIGLLLPPDSLFIEVPFTLLLGWIPFLAENVLQMEPRFDAFLIWLVCAVALLVGLQLGMSRFYAERGASENGAEGNSRVWQFRWTVAAVVMVHVLFVGGLSTVGVFDQAYWLTQHPWLTRRGDGHVGARRRMTSGNNLKQLGLGALQHHDIHRGFPQSTFANDGRPLQSWITPLLPFLEQTALYDTIDLKQPWDDPAQKAAFATRVEFLENPGILEEPPEGRPAPAHYSANRYVIGPQRKTTFDSIPDGMGNTLLFGEVNQEIPAWGDPINWRDPAHGINQRPDGFGSPYYGGAQFTLADGSTRFLTNDIDPEVLKALSTPASGEDLNSADW